MWIKIGLSAALTKFLCVVTLFSMVLTLSAAEVNEYAPVDAIFNEHCLDCHGSQEPEGKFVLENYESLLKGGEIGAALMPGRSADSLLVRMIEGKFEEDGKKVIMPPGKRKKLSSAEIATIKTWIDAGAHGPPAGTIANRELVVPKIIPKVAPRIPIMAVAYAPGPQLIAVASYGEVELRSAVNRQLTRTL